MQYLMEHLFIRVNDEIFYTALSLLDAYAFQDYASDSLQYTETAVFGQGAAQMLTIRVVELRGKIPNFSECHSSHFFVNVAGHI